MRTRSSGGALKSTELAALRVGELEVEPDALEEVDPEHAASPHPPSPASAAFLRNARRLFPLPIALAFV